MKKFALGLGAALIASSAMFSAPALASVTVVGTAPTAAELTASCQTYLHADVNGGFMAVAINAKQVDTVVSNTESEHVITYSGEATLGGLEMLSYSKNSGADKQVFGDKFYTTKTYPSGLETWTTTVVVESHISYDCKIYKLTKNGKEVIPSDKQHPSQVSASWTTTTVTDHQRAIASATVTLDEPVFYDRAPICQLKKIPGSGRGAVATFVWEAKGGYDGVKFGPCSDDLYDDAPVFGGTPD